MGFFTDKKVNAVGLSILSTEKEMDSSFIEIYAGEDGQKGIHERNDDKSKSSKVL